MSCKLSMVARILGLALLLCSVAFSASISAASDTVLDVGHVDSDLETLDPQYTTGRARFITDMLFNALIRYKPGNILEFEPDLAVSIPEPVDLEDGQRSWTFKLREGVLFHPFGDTPSCELTSEDVVYSLQKAADPSRSACSGEYAGLSFLAIDRYTVQVIAENPISQQLLLPKLADFFGSLIVSKKAVEEMGDEEFATHPVGTGPFRFEEYVPMSHVTLVAHKEYFRGEPEIQTVKIHFMPSLSSRELGLRNGELDLIYGSRSSDWVEKISVYEGISAVLFGPSEPGVLYFDITKEPFTDIRVRKAVAYALDRNVWTDYYGDFAEPMYSQVPAQYLAGGLTKEEVEDAGLLYEVDRQKARQLLAEAGYSNGFSLKVVITEDKATLDSMLLIQSQLAEVGIDLQLEVVPHKTWHARIRNDDNKLDLYEAWRTSADSYLTRFFHSDSIVVTGAAPDTNFSHYDKLDYLIERARVEPTSEVQNAFWQGAQIMILEDMVAYPLYGLKFAYAKTDRLDFGYELQSSLVAGPQIKWNTMLE